MNNLQIWQTIALDLKRAAILLTNNRKKQAEYFLNKAEKLYKTQNASDRNRISKNMVSFKGHPEEILLGSSIIMGRI